MNNLQTDNAPSLSVVIPPFIFGALSFLTLAVLVILAGSDFLGIYFAGKMLALTHLAVLGWGTMIVLGALYQLVPVVFETGLFSEGLAKATFWGLAGSIMLLVYAFWMNDFTNMLPLAATLLFTALSLFIINILVSKMRGKRNIQSTFITAAIFWLFLTALLGLLMAFNFRYNFFSQIHLHYLKVHAHLGLIGWFVSLIIGVSSTLIPMFLVSHQLNEQHLRRSFYLINGGLALLTLDWWFLSGSRLVPLYWVMIMLGIASYLLFVREAYVKRLRKILDTGMQYTLLAVAGMTLPLLISLLLLTVIPESTAFQLRAVTLYGFSLIFGLITPIILGQTYKTLPFIIWLYKYKEHVGKSKTPMPKDLYSESIGRLQLYLYYATLALLMTALIFRQSSLATLGNYTLLSVAVLYTVNVFNIITHKIKIERPAS